jgi:hypothetical protein
VQVLPLGFVIFQLHHFKESKDFYQTSVGFYFLNIQVLHSLDILKQDVLYGVRKFNSRPVDKYPKAKPELLKKMFTYSGPNLWNELPFSIWQASSHNTFKTKVKSLISNDDVS